jgi:hypothetical protein
MYAVPLYYFDVHHTGYILCKVLWGTNGVRWELLPNFIVLDIVLMQFLFSVIY